MSESKKPETIGFTEEEIKYLRECAKEPKENWDIVSKIMKYLDEIKEKNPEAIFEALEEVTKRNG